MKYTPQFFIDKYEAIPEEKWCCHVFSNAAGQRCAFGHIMYSKSRGFNLEINHEYIAVQKIFLKGKYSSLSKINDGECAAYAQSTPKARVLAALRDLDQTIEVEIKEDICANLWPSNV